MVVIFVFWLVGSLIIALLAAEKVIGFWGGLLISLLTSPVIGFIVVVLSKSNDQQRLENEAYKRAANSDTGTTVADELEKLAALKERGIITSYEFETQKQKILSR